MKTFDSLSAWQEFRKNITAQTSLGFVPTMGNLHAGHQSLLARAKQENDLCILSLVVNPTQFNDADDFQHYPRTPLHDLQMAEQAGADIVIQPDPKALYPDAYRYRISENQISLVMEGLSRPGHFDGMLTVVLKLLQLVKPSRAYFGEKDYQQLQLVQGLVEAFFLDVAIVACPTIRDNNGLALSSRNHRLTPAQYALALHFAKLLQSKQTCSAIAEQLSQLGFQVEYIEEHNGRRYGAVTLGKVRLIDNLKIMS